MGHECTPGADLRRFLAQQTGPKTEFALTLQRDRLAREWVEMQALRFTNYRSLSALMKTGLPGLTGEAVMRLYDEGAGWLNGSPAPGEPR